MLFDYINIILGMIKCIILKIFYFKRIKFNTIPKINCNFRIALRKKTFLKFGNNFKARNNINFRNDYDGQIIIGNNVFFNDGVSLNCQKKIIIGDNVAIGHNTLIIDHDHDYKNNMKEFVSEEIIIGNNVWIGANVIILKGSIIPNNTVIAANTLVTKNIKFENDKNNLVYDKKNNIVKTMERYNE